MARLTLLLALVFLPADLPRDTLPADLPVKVPPKGLPGPIPAPPDNPITEAKVRLGRRLFFDPILSADGTVSCASCHDPRRGFAGSEPVVRGIGGKLLHRHPPTLLNRAYGQAFFWDGRETTLEAQALRPIANPDEMGKSVADALKRLAAHAEYPAMFRAAFTEGLSEANLGRAIASFERVLLTGDSPLDRFRAGDLTTLTSTERHGLWLYESRARCWRCHSGPNFSDEQFHNTGVSWGKMPADLGRFETTRREADRGQFKTPTLRGLAKRAAFMHDGSITSLEDVVEFYNRGGGANPRLDSIMQPLGLNAEEVKSLAAFLRALSSEPR